MLRSISSAVWAGVLSLLLLGLASASAAPITPLQEFSSLLPSGEGKILVFKYCVACHGPKVARTRLQAGKWMDDQWGAILEREDVAPLASYLDENFSSDSKGEDGLEALLPPGEPKKIISQKCISCHDQQVTGRRLESRAGLPSRVWKKILDRMKNYGTPFREEEIQELSVYLGSGLKPNDSTGPDGSVKEFYSFLPDGAGKDLVAANCLSCHGPSDLKKRIDQPSRTAPAYWDVTVRRMKDKWDAPLEEQEVEATIQYLNSHFNK